MTLDQFEGKLAKIIGRPSTLRPFVCEGSPLDCRVFIVGYNPATTMDGDWWRYWKPGYGYQKYLWKEEYLRHRNGEVSKTQRRIDAIVAELSTVRILEGNIDARPSKRKSEYPKPITTPFDYVLEACTPKVIIAHGVDAVAYLQDWAKGGKLIACKHFIYVGQERTAEIIKEARDAWGSAQLLNSG